jgi:hypothetical protein
MRFIQKVHVRFYCNIKLKLLIRGFMFTSDVGEYETLNAFHFVGDKSSYINGYILFLYVPAGSVAVIDGRSQGVSTKLLGASLSLHVAAKVHTPAIPIFDDGTNPNIIRTKTGLLIVHFEGKEIVLQKM